MPTPPTPAIPKPSRRSWWIEWFYRLPSALLKDPLGALIEKEFRFLVRSPRFRLVFLMGFTFGLVIWLPMVFVPRGRWADSSCAIISPWCACIR